MPKLPIMPNLDLSPLGLSGPRPAEIVTLPSHMDCHEHQYSQVVIGLKGQAEFEVSGKGNLVGPGQGCVVTACSDHA
ncbi:AraC family transcriptional regulator, partial [Vibrio fortis]